MPRLMRPRFLLAGFSFFLFVVGCGGSVGADNTQATDSGATQDTTPMPVDSGGVDTAPEASPDSGTADTNDAASLDHGAPSTKYPAFTPWFGEIRNNGGAVLSAPVIVTVTWLGDGDADGLEAFGDHLGDTTYWAAVGKDYGVGKTTSGASYHVRMKTAAPSTLADTEAEAFVSDHATHPGKDGFPSSPTDQYLYVLYIPNSTSLTYAGADMCSSGIGGYHTSANAGAFDVAYAIVGDCGGGGIGERTVTASHEIAEAATDPRPGTNPGYVHFTDETVVWGALHGYLDEVGDVCNSQFFMDSEGSFKAYVQRSWSNSSGKAGHDPCVPTSTEVYFNTTPLTLEDVNVDLSAYGGNVVNHTKGIHIAKGETKTFPVGFYSDGSTGGPWTLKVTEGLPGHAPSAKHLTVSVDKTTGENGEKAWITVTVNSTDATRSSVINVSSSQGTRRHSMPIAIASR